MLIWSRDARVTNINAATEIHHSSALFAIVRTGLGDQMDERMAQKVNRLMSRNTGDFVSNQKAPCLLR